MPRLRADEDVFAAIASPVRRMLLDRLLRRTQTAGRLAASFEMSPAAISQQLGILRKAGLVTATRAGRHRLYRLAADPLRKVAAWMLPYDRLLAERLKTLENELRAHTEKPRWR